MRAPRRRLSAIRVDFRSSRPIYLQIILEVERQAARGRLRPNDQLPTVRDLAAQLGVNFNTVARAYRILQRAGVVSAQQGRGTFAASRFSARNASRLTLQTMASAYISEARRLGFSEAQMAAAITNRLNKPATMAPAGDNHE